MRARRPSLAPALVLLAGCSGTLLLQQDGPARDTSDLSTPADTAGSDAKTAAPDPHTLVVDDDLQQCPNADFTSIEAAVQAAPPGGRIRVCPGYYVEDVTVDKPLQLFGAGPAPEQRAADPSREAVVQPPNVGFAITVSGVEVDGFTIVGNGQLAGTFGIGVALGATGLTLTRNYLVRHDTAIGWGFGPGPRSPSVVAHNRIERCHEGLALRAVVTAPPDPQPSLVEVHHNLFVFSANAVELLSVRDARVHDNDFQGCEIGIGAFQEAIDNALSENTFTGLGVAPTTAITLDSSHRQLVINNRITGEATGIEVVAGDGHWIGRNRIDHSGGDGIFVITGTGNTFFDNHSLDNGHDGLRLSGGSSSNELVNNHLFGNAEFDARDDNRPANTWVKTQCDTDFPPGTICVKH